MDELTRTLLLALIQGMTEFLPVSSSAHLVLPAQLLGWQDQGLAFDVAVHLGSLLAVLAYFRNDLVNLARGTLQSVARREMNNAARMVLYLAIASVPVAVAGFLLEDAVAGELRSIGVIATTTVVFGLLLGLADMRSAQRRKLTLAIAVFIGLAQALAIVPGTSRSGITMTAAMLAGMGRKPAARFSFLLSIPVILGAGALQTVNLVGSAEPVDWQLLGLGVAVSAITAYLAIHWFLGLVEKVGLMPFVVYRCLLGGVLFFYMTMGL